MENLKQRVKKLKTEPVRQTFPSFQDHFDVEPAPEIRSNAVMYRFLLPLCVCTVFLFPISSPIKTLL